MQFQTPQFIEVEDKIFGPLTFKQFVYVIGGGGLCFVLYIYLPGILSFFLIPVVAGFAGALAFYKINNKPFIYVVEAALRYVLGDKLYIWKKVEKKKIAKDNAVFTPAIPFVPKLSDSKLKDLAWSLDVHKKIQ